MPRSRGVPLRTCPLGAVDRLLPEGRRREGWRQSSCQHPEHWRFRAEEARTIADQMTHEVARTIMRRIAMDYDRLAKLAEEQIADQERGTIDD